MTGGEVAQIIVALATLVSSIGALLVGWRNSRKIEAVHQATNGITDRLVASTAKASHAEGVADEKARMVGKRPRKEL